MSRRLLRKKPSLLHAINIFDTVSSQNIANINNDAFLSYLEVRPNQEVHSLKLNKDKDGVPRPAKKFMLQFSVPVNVKVLDVYYYSLKEVLAEIGGHFSALIHILIFIFSPILYRTLNNSILQSVK